MFGDHDRYCEIYINFAVFEYMYTYLHKLESSIFAVPYQSSEPELTYPIVPAIVYRKQSTSENDERVTDAIEPSQCSATAWSV